MREQEKLMLFEQVTTYGFTAAMDALVTSTESLAVLPEMALEIDFHRMAKFTQLEDGRIFRSTLLMHGPDGTLVVKKEFEAMVRKIERGLRR